MTWKLYYLYYFEINKGKSETLFMDLFIHRKKWEKKTLKSTWRKSQANNDTSTEWNIIAALK